MCMSVHPNWPEYVSVGVNDRCWVVERDEIEQCDPHNFATELHVGYR